MAQTPQILSAADTAISDPNTDVSVVYAASTNRLYHVVDAIYAAFSGPTGEDYVDIVREVQILEGDHIVFRKVMAENEADIVFEKPVSTGAGKALSVKLTAGGEEIVGTLSILHSTLRS